MVTDHIIDPSVFAELSANMGEDFAIELVSTFLEEAPRMVSDLGAALEQADTDAFRRAAHSLKSNADVFGAGHLSGIARQMELGGLPEEGSSMANLRITLLETSEALRKLIND